MLDAPKVAPQSVRYLNELRALDVLFRDGAMSRADLARTLGLNRSTTGSIISSLLAESLVVERRRDKPAEPRAQTGRPGIDVELNPEGALFIGAEIEVEQVTAVVIDLTGRLIRREAAAFPAGRLPPERSAEKLAEMVRSIVEYRARGEQGQRGRHCGSRARRSRGGAARPVAELARRSSRPTRQGQDRLGRADRC